MHSARVDAFFSCSFREEDKSVNEIFQAVCRALDLNLVNVSTASPSTPPAVAREKIENSQLLVAICVRREELPAGRYLMPQAVQDELSIAYGKGLPILMFVEDGVAAEGFKGNYGTYQEFSRANVGTPDFIENVTRSIHEAKLATLGPEILGAEHGMAGCYSDYIRHLVELQDNSGEYVWKYTTAKKLCFTDTWKRSFPSGVWPTVQCDSADSQKAYWKLELLRSSRDIQLRQTVEKNTHDCIEVQLKPEPHPENGDFVEFRTEASSPNINAIWLDQVTDSPMVHLERGDFACADGLVFIHRTKSAVIEFRLPSSYGLTTSDIVPFVGSYTSKVDYEVPSEVQRAEIRVDDFGGNVAIRLTLNSPLPGHIYGIAWNPPARRVPRTQVLTSHSAAAE